MNSLLTALNALAIPFNSPQINNPVNECMALSRNFFLK